MLFAVFLEPCQMIKKLLIAIAVFIVGLPVFILANILRPFVIVRFGEVYSARIGHIAGNLDNYLSSRAPSGGREISIFALQGSVANWQLTRMFERTGRMRFLTLPAKAVLRLKGQFPKSSHFIDFNVEMWAIHGETALRPANISFTADEVRKGTARLQERGIHGEFICFNNRDNAYLKTVGGDGNTHDYRNSSVHSYRPLIQHALTLGYPVVRLGNIVEEEIAIDHADFVDFSGKNSDDFMDIFLLDRARIFIGNNSGFSNVRRVFRKPEIIVNFAPFAPNHLWPFSYGTVILPKKMYSHSLGRLMTISEMRSLNVDIHYQGDYFKDQGIDVLENTGDEILAAFKEGLARFEGTFSERVEDRERQGAFWAHFASREEKALFHDRLGMRICADFLEKQQTFLT